MSRPLPEVTYTSHPQLRRPRLLLRQMGRDLRASRELAWQLFVRNLRAQYRQSLLGYGWVVVPPLVTTLTWVLFHAAGILTVGQTDIPYPLYVLAGTMLWQSFVDALNVPLNSFTVHRTLLTKLNFPREAVLLAGLAQVLFDLAIRLALTLGVLLWYHFSLRPTILLALFGVLALVGLGFVFGLLLVPLGLLYQDVQRALVIVTTLWFFLTPVVYPPLTASPLEWLVRLNPVSPLLTTTREWLITGNTVGLGAFAWIGVATVFVFGAAWVLLRLAMPHLIARMSTR